MRDAIIKVSVVFIGACLTIAFILALRVVTQAPEIDGPASAVIEKRNDDANTNAVRPETDMELYLKKVPVKPPKLIEKPPVPHEFNYPIIRSNPKHLIIYRAVPIMPENAERSGYCTFDLDVGTNGRVKNVLNMKCSDKVLEQSSKNSANKWVFNPNVVHGELKSFTTKNLRITYRLLDEQGQHIPE